VHFTTLLRDSTLDARMKVPGLPKYRADIILPGLVIVREMMELVGSNHIVVNTKGIREGIIIDTISPSPEKVTARDRRKAALEFGERLHYETKHSRHVAKLAVSMWEQTDPSTRVLRNERQLLEIAGILHDIGYSIAYERHHKHSQHLIRHADLPGLTPRERRIVAAIARYHRGALPKRKHEGYGDLVEEDREVVRRLAGILRLADGLDRGRMQRVKSVVLDNGDGTCLAKLEGAELGVETHGGLDKGDLFEKAYHVRLSIESGGKTYSRERDPAA
jgi:exopolyphosphatase/guanosine-5'-triphosphate,3'-diphosphate pyrophosphatase